MSTGPTVCKPNPLAAEVAVKKFIATAVPGGVRPGTLQGNTLRNLQRLIDWKRVFAGKTTPKANGTPNNTAAPAAAAKNPLANLSPADKNAIDLIMRDIVRNLDVFITLQAKATTSAHLAFITTQLLKIKASTTELTANVAGNKMTVLAALQKYGHAIWTISALTQQTLAKPTRGAVAGGLMRAATLLAGLCMHVFSIISFLYWWHSFTAGMVQHSQVSAGLTALESLKLLKTWNVKVPMIERVIRILSAGGFKRNASGCVPIWTAQRGYTPTDIAIHLTGKILALSANGVTSMLGKLIGIGTLGYVATPVIWIALTLASADPRGGSRLLKMGSKLTKACINLLTNLMKAACQGAASKALGFFSRKRVVNTNVRARLNGMKMAPNNNKNTVVIANAGGNCVRVATKPMKSTRRCMDRKIKQSPKQMRRRSRAGAGRLQ